MQVILTDDRIKAQMTAFLATLLTTAEAGLILFTDDLTPTRNTVLADLHQPTFTGYVPLNLTFTAVYRKQDGSWAASMPDKVFICSAAPVTPQIVYGWAIVDDDDTPTVIYAAGRLDTPLNIVAAGDGLILGGEFTFNQTGGQLAELSLNAIRDN